jgi:hypothetical protein
MISRCCQRIADTTNLVDNPTQTRKIKSRALETRDPQAPDDVKRVDCISAVSSTDRAVDARISLVPLGPGWTHQLQFLG